MPSAPADTGRPLPGAALAQLRECARVGAEDVLALYPEVGDRETQRALDSCLDQVADLLREIDATAADLAVALAADAPASGVRR
ncbi:hypothetical protein [Nostocoides sp. HKS02]|uniref:hypothetical protein n=1 Tax=Nostocoides sp. HKS02 TaxID=1813880 RepID=UPI0012B4AC94|nr:hypothetical protein [Tetrasphaera sp. HKS02]QGN56752.1 hypothetical protein GKE56_01235 [Tetrasphaera sp. HKS02]